MLRRTRNSLLFGWATFLSATIGLGACILILIEERLQSKRRVGKQLGAYLADKRRAVIFYSVLSKVYDVLNVFFYTDTMRNDVVELADIHQGSRVLDVGCGTGYTTEAVLKRLEIGEVDGIDMTSQQLMKAARKFNPEKVVVNLSRGDAENLPFKNETFDAIVSFGALEYFPNPKRAMQEMARVVRPGGRVVVGGPESEWFSRTFLDRMLYTPSAKEVVELFNQARFMDVRCVLTGVDTFFHTDRYVVIVVGTR